MPLAFQDVLNSFDAAGGAHATRLAREADHDQ
jgi:hypothetical protein